MNMPRRPFSRRLLTFARWAAIVYLLLVLFIWYGRIGDRLIAQPAPGPLPAPGAERFVIPYPHGELEAFRAVWPTDQTPQICVLYFVGNDDRVNPWVAGVARTWSDQTGLAVECVGVNLPGFGLSTGPANLDRMAPAGVAAFDHTRARLPHTPIVAQGQSLGTTAALAMAAQRPVAAIQLQDPPPLRQLTLEYHGWWNGWLLAIPVALRLPADIDAIANARATKVPCLFITSGGDTRIPPHFQQRIFDALAGPKQQVIIANARHCAPPDATAAAEIARLRPWLLREAAILK